MSQPHTTPSPRWQVFSLCAQWCGTCRDWRGALAQEAALHPQVDFFWVDIEDEADAVGDLDIETFPTLLIAQGEQPRFLGTVLPSAPAVGKLLQTLREDPAAGRCPPEAGPLLARLRSIRPPPL